MSEHRRRYSPWRVFSRLRAAREPGRWTARGRDERGLRTGVRVGVGDGGVTVEPSRPGEVTLPPWEVGRLRAALHEAVRLLGDPEAARAIPAHPAALSRRAAWPTGSRTRVSLAQSESLSEPTQPIWPAGDHDVTRPEPPTAIG